MKSKIILFTVAILVGFTVQAQRRVALHHNGTATMFGGSNMYQDAYNAAVNGDTIYLPGGTFTAVNIAKQLTIYGAGFHPDSTLATGNTIMGGFRLDPGSKKSHIEGLYIDGGIGTSGSNSNDSTTITRCYVKGINLQGERLQIIGNVIMGNINGNNSANAVIRNNFISNHGSPVHNFQNNSWFCNNTIVEKYYYGNIVFSNVTDCLIENNVILIENTGIVNTSNNTFRNNMSNQPQGSTENIWVDNYMNVPISDFFVSYTPFTLGYFDFDFHLQNPEDYLGTDGKQVGFYGGMLPFKEGSVPSNPHIQLKNIATETDDNGDLQIQIKVAAQEN